MSQGKFKDLSGQRFGRWLVSGRGPNSSNEYVRYFCRCDCGNELLVLGINLTRGLTKGCIKCARKQEERHHGMSETKTYYVWIQMIERCHNSNHKYYKWYGERGIKVCERWQEKFQNFLEDMGEAPKDLSIDRIDNEKGYSKDNCKWATKIEQQRNRRNSIQIGEIHNGWEIFERGPKKKTYGIRCVECNFVRYIQSCNFRRKHACECQGDKK